MLSNNNLVSPPAPISPREGELNAQTAFAIIANNATNKNIDWGLLHKAFFLVPGAYIPDDLEPKMKKLKY
jgi:hypothetical protein